MSTALASPAAASYPDRVAALTAYESVAADQVVDPGWTGAVDGCIVGTESGQSLEATLHTVNVLRTTAGLEPVTFDATLNRKALAAALMVGASGTVDHDPGESSPCYSEDGADASSKSNLFLGLSGAEAMVGYVQDPGVSDLGHRRWLLDPGAQVFGSGSTGSSNALTVVGSHGSGSRMSGVADDELVAWPPPGWVPSPWVFNAWSAAIGTSSGVDVSSAKVSATFDGSAVSVTRVHKLPSGPGVGSTLGWQTGLPATATSGDHFVKVSITGVKIDGRLQGIHYTVNSFDPADRDAGPGAPLDLTDPVTPAGPMAPKIAGRSCKGRNLQVSRAKRALRRASKSHRKAAIRKTKKNLKARKRARTLACR